MGLMDRDYWKEKKNDYSIHQSNNVNPRVKNVISQLQKQIDEQERNRLSYRKLVIYVIFMTIGVLLISLNKIKKDKEELDESKTQTIKVDIIPGIFSVVQSNFKTSIETLDIKFDISHLIENKDRYLIGNEFYFSDKSMGGKISYKVLSVDSNSIVKGKVTLMMWGGQEPLLNSKTRPEKPFCIGPLIRSETRDDKIKCDGVLSSNLSLLVNSKTQEPITLRLINSNNVLKGYFKNSNYEFEEIGGFKYRNETKISNEITNYIEFIGKINNCSELKPIEVITLSIKNNNIESKPFIQKSDNKFECQNQISTNINGEKVIHKVSGSK